jgi:hypothetical protein
VGSVVVVEVGEAVEAVVEGPEFLGQFVDGVELVSPGSVASLDGSVVNGGAKPGHAGGAKSGQLRWRLPT